MTCKFCGNVIEDNSDICFICGKKVEATEAPAADDTKVEAEDKAEDNREMAVIFMIAFVVELVIIAGMIALYVLKLKRYRKLVKQDEEGMLTVDYSKLLKTRSVEQLVVEKLKFFLFENTKDLKKTILRVVCGLVVFLVMNVVLKALFGIIEIEGLKLFLRVIRYASLVFVTMGVYPLIFGKSKFL